MLQNFLYLYKKKTQLVFFIFHFEQLSFFPYECPGLCRRKTFILEVCICTYMICMYNVQGPRNDF